MADQEQLKTVISVYRCSGFALATISGCAVLFMTVLTLISLSSVSAGREKGQKSAILASWTLWDCSVEQRDFRNSNLLATFTVRTPSLK